MKKQDNRGASFVMVVIAIAVVAVLAVTVLWIALVNLQMKITDKENTDNFYSAEGVLDQICTGLQGDMSEAYSSGYSIVMENYAQRNEIERQNVFVSTYVQKLKERLQADASGLNYDIDKLRGYVDDKLTDDTSYPYAKITSTSAPAGSDNGLLNTYSNRTVIKGIRIDYTDEKGYNSIIETDISLEVPTMTFTASGGIPELFTYSLIGNDGLSFTDKANRVNISGNIYSGSDYAVGKEDSNSTTSVTIANNTTVNISDSSYFIAEGDIEVGNHETVTATSASNSVLNISSDCQLWTDNININGAKAAIEGITYVSDDLTIKGSGSNVVLGKNNGKYVGFGNDGTVANDSSAIIINGVDASLDMRGLKMLMLAGNAYINTSAIVGDGGAVNQNITMGESISIKGNQIAYLIPPECIGTEGNEADAMSVYRRNPLKYSEYNEIIGSDNDKPNYVEINENIVSSKIGKPLSAYLPDGGRIENYVRKVFVPSSDGNQSNGLVYYYINLPQDNAAQYYEDYYNADSTKLESYTDFYTEQIQVNETASIYTVGNYSIFDGNNLNLMKGIVDGIDMDAESAAVKQTYTALNSKLITEYADLTAAQMTASLFTNLVDEEKLEDVTSSHLGGSFTFESDYQDETYRAVVKDGDYIYNEGSKNDNVSIVIATGDVEINADFTGTIIAKGKIDVSSSCKIKNVYQDIFKTLLQAAESEDEDAIMLYELLDDGANYLGNSSKFSDTKKEDTKIDYSSLIKYQNWKKL